LALSFLIQIVISPAEGNTISFILSYLALAGIIVIGRSLYSLFSGKAPDFILQPLSASCGAFIATAGITSSVFGVIFPMGIITGLILVPLITIFMIGSMIWLALDMVSLSGFLNVPLSLLYQLMEKIVSAASGIPGVSATGPFVIYALSFAALAAAAVLEYRRRAALLRLQPFV
jgi:competence protein ComEC